MMTHMRGVGATGLLFLVVLSQPGIASAHGSVSGEDDPCLRRIGEQVMHFNAYQPQYQLNDQYCTDIPKDGDTFLVVDLVDPALRDEPVGMRVVKGTGSKEGDNQTVADIRPSLHPDGILRGEVRLDEGLYTVTIATEKQNLMKRPQYLLAGAHDRLSATGPYDRHPAARGAACCLAGVQTHPVNVAAELVGCPPILGSWACRPVGVGLRNWRRLNTNGPDSHCQCIRGMNGFFRIRDDRRTQRALEPINAYERSTKECVAHGIGWEIG